MKKHILVIAHIGRIVDNTLSRNKTKKTTPNQRNIL